MEENKIEVKKVSEKEYLIGSHRIFIDDDNIQNIILVGDNDERLAHALNGISASLAKESKGKMHSLVDLNRAGKPSAEMRKMGRDMIDDEKTGKVALFGLHPVARVLASFVMGITRKKDVKFFKTREDAVAWLRE